MKSLLTPQKIAATVCALGLLTSTSMATDWKNPAANGNYNVGTSWIGDVAPSGPGSIANIMINVPSTTSDVTVSLQNINTTVGELSIGDINEAKVVTLRNGGTQAASTGILTFDNAGQNAQLTVRARNHNVGTTFMGAGATAAARTALDVQLKSNLDIQSIGSSSGPAQFHIRLVAGGPGNHVLNLSANSTSTGAVIFQGGFQGGSTNAGYIADGDNGGTIAVQQSSAITELHLYGTNTYTGGTLVSAGKLFVNNASGSGTGSGDVVLEADTTLGGFGSVGGNVITEGAANLQVGFGTTGGFTIDQDLDLGGDLNVIYSSVFDLLEIGGDLNLNGYAIIFNLNGYEGEGMELISFDNLVGGDLSNFAISGLSGYGLELGDNGISLVVVVPEPATYAAIITLLALGVAISRRRKRS